MSYAIIGFGKIGQTLAKAFARKGLEVSVATTRDPKSFASAAAAIGPKILFQIAKDFFAAIGSYNKQGLLALVAADIEWIIPGEGWPLAGTHRGHAELATVLQRASEEIETTYSTPPEFVAQGDRVLVVGVATGKIKATNKPFEDDWVFDITVRNGKLTKIQEYIDTQALARASQRDASGLA